MIWIALSLLLGCKRGTTPPTGDGGVLSTEVLTSTASSLPVTTASAGAEIAPIQQGDLSAPEGMSSGDGLRVLLVGPQGEQTSPRQAVVVFDRPMVALAQLDAMTAAVPLSCAADGGGALSGKARWAGTTTAVWIPESNHFPRSTAFTCTVPKGVAATDGTALSEEIRFQFETERAQVDRTVPYSGNQEVDPTRPMLLVFNQDVSIDEVKAHLEITDGAGKKVPFTVARPALQSSDAQEDDNAPDVRVSEREQERSALIAAKLNRDTAYTLSLSPGLRGSAGPLGTREAFDLSFHTIPPAEILSWAPLGQDIDPVNTIEFGLATRTEAAELGAKISISPTPPDGWNPADAYAWNTWSYSVRFKPMTTYTITVEPGAKDAYGQTYTEKTSWSFTTGHLRPMIDAPQRAQLYPANNPSTLPFRSRNLQNFYVGMRSVPLDEAMAMMASWQSWDASAPPRIDSPQVVVSGGAPTDRVRVDQVDMAPYLKDGRGLVYVEAWSPEVVDSYRDQREVSRALLQVTDLGTTLKIGPYGVMSWVTRLSDGKPVENAEVRLYLSGAVVWTGRTDAQGIAVAKGVVPKDWQAWSNPFWAVVTHGSDTSLTSSEAGHGLSAWSPGILTGEPGQSTELRLHAFTDRGVYKPGDTIHVALTGRTSDVTGLHVPDGANVRWTCRDARDLDLGEDEGKLNSHGAVSWDVRIPAEAAVGYGACDVTVTSGDLTASTTVSLPVYEYRAPTFRVDVSAPTNTTVGTPLSTTGHGRYLFGAPMAGAEASWTVTAVPVLPQPEGWDAFSFHPVTGKAWWDAEYEPSETLATGTGKLDAQGQTPIKVELPATEEPRTREVLTEVTVTDVARQRISNRATTLVHPADLYIGLKPGTALGQEGQDNAWELVVVTPEGQAKAGVPVELNIVRRTWDVIRQKGVDGLWTWVSTPKDDVVDKQTVTSGSGATPFHFKPTSGGYYVIQATARDSAGRTTRTEDGAYVYGAGISWARDDSGSIELVPDKARYQPGDTAHVLVKAPRAGLTGLVTVEREGVLDRRVLTFKSTADVVDIPLAEDAVPNLYVSVVLVDGAPPANSPDATIPGAWLGTTKLTVDPGGRHLKVAIDTDKATYQPGDEVLVTVSVGRPASSAKNATTTPVEGAHVVLYAVDYGVLSLTGYQTPDAFDTYYAHHPLRIQTVDNRTAILNRGQLLAKGGETGGSGGESTRARSNFVTTPLWDADLSTRKDGKLIRKFKLPDNLTTFQLMAVVDAGADAFGAGDKQVSVALPLMAQPALPRVLRVGDRALAGIVVHNNRDQARDVSVTASATGVRLKGSPTTVSVPAHGAVEVPFALLDPSVGKADFRFDVAAGDDKDAVEVSLPVLRPVPAETVATAGVADPSASETIAAVTGALPGAGGLTVQVSPTVMVGTDASLTYLLDYPHGCLEQTSSRMLAAILAQELGERLPGAPPKAKLTEYIQTGLAKMASFDDPSGGMTLWPGSRDPNALATAAAVEALARAGQPIPDARISFLREFMGGQWMPWWWSESTRHAAQARVALTLARLGLGDAGFNSRIYEYRGDLSLTARAELLETLARTTGKDTRTSSLEQDLQGAVTVEATTARLRDQDEGSALWDGEMSATAAAVSALLQSNPKNPLIPRLARGLVASREGGRWGNTYTTLRALRSLTDYTGVFEKGGLPNSAEVTLAGKSLLSASFKGPVALTATQPIDQLTPGELTVSGKGGPVYYESRLSYALASMPPRDEGFTLTRTYAMLEGTGNQGQVTPGAMVQVTIRVVTPVDRANVAVVDPLPAGLEAVNTFFATTAQAYSEEETPDTGSFGDEGAGEEDLPQWSSWVFNHRELRDDGLYLYADYMPAGIHVYQYLARATTPGDYARPAATVEEMYRPEIFGRTDADRFVVGAGPVASAP